MRFSLALSIWKPARLEMCSLAGLTFVDFITRGVLNAPVLCCSCVSTKKGFRQVLQTVAQCTETAGATHQGSVEMTSPDKCTSDSSPAPIPPPQAPPTRAQPRTGNTAGQDGGPSQSCGREVRSCRYATPSGKEMR